MVFLRGIVFLALFMVGTLVSAGARESFDSTAMSASSHSMMVHGASDLTTKGHCATIVGSDRNSAEHDGCCRDMNCGACAHCSITLLQSAEIPSLLIGVQAKAPPVIPLVGINIAPETGPPKSCA